MRNVMVIDKARWEAVKFYPYELVKSLEMVVVTDEESGTMELISERPTGTLRRTWPLELLGRMTEIDNMPRVL